MRVSKLISIIVYVCIALVLLSVIGIFIAYFNNGQKSFYVQLGSEKFYNDCELTCSSNEYKVFYVKNSLSVSDEQSAEIDYSVKVVSNVTFFKEQGFDSYKVADNLFSLEELDVTEFFDICIEENRFLFKLADDLTLTKILAKKHDVAESSIIDVPELDLLSKPYLTLIVSNNADEASINFGLIRGE